MVHDPKLKMPEKIKDVLPTSDNMNVDTTNIGGTPMESSVPNWLQTGASNAADVRAREPEGRVHGGSLLAMLKGGSRMNDTMPRNWI